MLYDFLQKENENKRIEDMFSQLSIINKNTEMISKQILLSVGSIESKIEAELYEVMFMSSSLHDFTYWKTSVSPKDVFSYEKFEDLIRAKIPSIKITKEDAISISSTLSITEKKVIQDSKEYTDIRNKMVKILESYSMTIESYLKKA